MASMRDRGRYETFSVSNSSMTKVFGWMFYGLFVTFASALGLYLCACNRIISVESYSAVLTISAVCFLIFSFISIFIMEKTQSKTAGIIIYSAYALMLGLTLSSLFVVFEMGEIIYSLGVTGLVFGIMSLYGYFTKRDLSSFASTLFMILIGAMIISLVNSILYFFIPSAGLDIVEWMLSYVVLGVIIGYVAFDVQRVKLAAENGSLSNAMPIYLAFNLYSDFIYIFIRILNIIGEARN